MARSLYSHVALALALVAVAAPVFATPEGVEELYQRLKDGGDGAKQAAFRLFKRGDQDDRLAAMLRNADGQTKTGSRLCILEALTYGWLAREEDASRQDVARTLAFEALDDPSAEVAKLAVRTFTNIDVPSTYEYMGARLNRLRFAALESARGKQAVGLVEALERMRDPQRSTEVLVQVLDRRLGPELESLVQDALERMTGQRLRSPQWLSWVESVKDLTLEEWKQTVALQRAERLRRYEQDTEEIFKSLLAALREQPERLLEVLRDGLEQTSNRAVRKRSVVELGRMGRVDAADQPLRERALGLLRGQLPAQGEASPYYDEIQALVILNLGKTGDATLLPDIARFLGVTSSRMRGAAARALGTLGAAEAVGPLLSELTRVAELEGDRDPFLIEAILVALGRLGQNRTVEGEPTVSEVLVGFCRGILGAEGPPAPTSNEHLARASEALGKLRYEDPTELARAVELLCKLAVHVDPKVRFASVTALGPLSHPDGFDLLKARLGEEDEQYIRRAVLDAVGLQAAAGANTKEAIDLLVPFLFDSDEDGLRRRSFDGLKRLVGKGNLEVLRDLTDALLRTRDRSVALQVALPFLKQLPAPDDLPAEDELARRAIYFDLLTHRAFAQLGGDPQAALADFEAVLSGRGQETLSKESLPTYLGKGRAKLALDLPGEAFAIAREALALLDGDGSEAEREEVWTLALDAVEKTGARRPAAVEGLLKQLDGFAASVPIPLSERLERLRSSK